MRPGRRIGKILDYTTSANNRDGLAIRAAGDGLLARPEEGKILIVLSDGRPNDIGRIVNRPNSHNPQPYYGEYAVKDTAYEIRKLRSQGVYVSVSLQDGKKIWQRKRKFSDGILPISGTFRIFRV